MTLTMPFEFGDVVLVPFLYAFLIQAALRHASVLTKMVET